MSKQTRRLLAWWYLMIAAGFGLLALNSWLVGNTRTGIWVRVGFALAFLLLGLVTRRTRPD